MHNLADEAVLFEQPFHSAHAESVPMILVERTFHVLGDFVHVEEADADALGRHPANLGDRDRQAR